MLEAIRLRLLTCTVQFAEYRAQNRDRKGLCEKFDQLLLPVAAQLGSSEFSMRYRATTGGSGLKPEILIQTRKEAALRLAIGN